MKKFPLIILFGSKAKQTAGKISDTDVAVLDDHELDLSEKVKLGADLAQKLGVSEDRVDIVDLSIASPLLQHEVAKYGKLLGGSIHDFFRFRVLAWKRYQDTAKFRRRREQALKEYFHAQGN